jgi:hypothetical protein
VRWLAHPHEHHLFDETPSAREYNLGNNFRTAELT